MWTDTRLRRTSSGLPIGNLAGVMEFLFAFSTLVCAGRLPSSAAATATVALGALTSSARASSCASSMLGVLKAIIVGL